MKSFIVISALLIQSEAMAARACNETQMANAQTVCNTACGTGAVVDSCRPRLFSKVHGSATCTGGTCGAGIVSAEFPKTTQAEKQIR